MLRILFLLILIVSLLEIVLFVEIGGIIGPFWTIVSVVMTALIGAVLLRIQGLMTLMRAQQNLEQGRMPHLELVEGVILLLAGAFLLTPGFFTDTVGFLVLVPGFRRAVAAWLLRQASVFMASGGLGPGGPAGPAVHRRADGHYTIEGEARRED